MAYNNICEAYGEDVISQQTARRWFAKFGKEIFQNRDEVHQAITQYIVTKPAQFFCNGINKLIERWR